MIKYVTTNDPDYTAEITRLYNDCFSTGISGQYIDQGVLKQYINQIFEQGNVWLAVDDKYLAGVLLCLPLKFDESLPPKLKETLDVEKCLYIAELMVDGLSRGKGVGQALIDKCMTEIDKARYTDVVIRVWDKNIPALNLYLKAGFVVADSIVQTKKKPDGKELFEMKKLYLKKKL